MKNTSFDSFAEASDYARSLAKKGLKHNLRADGSRWTVDALDADTNEVGDCRRCSELSHLLETGKSIVSSLKSENSTLKASNEFLNSELARYKEQLSSFQNKIARQDAEIAALKHSLECNSKAVQGLLSK
jgi:chromosome segregation ATPase